VEHLDITISYANGVIVVTVGGAVDSATSGELREHLDMVSGYVVVDLTDATFLDPTGIWVLAATVDRLTRRGGALQLRNPSRTVRKTLRSMGLAELVEEEPVTQPDAATGARPIEVIAGQIAAAFATTNLDLLTAILADNATWDYDNRHDACRTRDEIVATFRELQAAGVDARVVEMRIGRGGVACHLQIVWPEATTGRRDSVYQVYLVDDGLVTQIQGFQERELALSAIQR
jgi:anti-sigma B factor antagonist